MIYLLYGSNTDKAREKLHELVGGLIKKKPDASHIKITDETFQESELDGLINSIGLFAGRAIVEMDMVFRNKEAKEVILSRLKDIAESENIFVFLEGELTKADFSKFEKKAEKVQEFSIKETGPKGRAFITDTGNTFSLKDFNIFSITDAFGRRDKKQLWVLFTKAKLRDISAEEIHGILFWQAKAMLQALAAKSAKEAGLNPYVYQKSLGFSKNFAQVELQKISSDLVSLYHDARRGIHDFDTALEKFILEV